MKKAPKPVESPLERMRRLWRAFTVGDGLTKREIRDLIKSAEAGLMYLHERREYLAAAKTALDLETLRSYL